MVPAEGASPAVEPPQQQQQQLGCRGVQRGEMTALTWEHACALVCSEPHSPTAKDPKELVRVV